MTTDTVVRAITLDGGFRVIAAFTTATVRGAIAAQKVRGDTARHFGELVTGAILIREAMAPKLRVQAILKGAHGRGSLVADAHPDGTSRGLVNFGAAARAEPGPPEVTVEPGALLQVMRTLPGGSLHQCVVEVPAAPASVVNATTTVGGSAISRALMAYMADSEQIVTAIATSTVLEDDDTVLVAGGYVVQLLPEAERGPLMVMTERLTEFPPLDDMLRTAGATPDTLLAELLYAMPFSRLEESRLSFGCHCSQLRLVESLSTLPRSDVEELIRDGAVLEINCDYCGKEYRIPPAQLRPLLTTS